MIRAAELFDLEDRLFDALFGIETTRMVAHEQLQIDGSSKTHATAYQAVWCRNLRKLIREAQRRGFKGGFLDIGSGKGKACLYASLFGFTPVLGIELDPALYRTSEENKKRFRWRTDAIQFLHADAAEYLLPDRRMLIFFYNPFDAEMLRTFLARNAENIRTHGSMIAYANDAPAASESHRSVLEAGGLHCLYHEPKRKISLWSYTK